MRWRVFVVLGVSTALAAPAHAEPAVPQLGGACPPEPAGVMTLLADQQTYAVCQRNPDGDYTWAAAPTPFEPNDAWRSYGPPISLHGQGMRNPNVISGAWTGIPQDPDAQCRAEQQVVVEAGVLSPPVVSEARAGEDLAVRLLPRLFSLTLSGDCLWTRDG